jgi:hypothetical protein
MKFTATLLGSRVIAVVFREMPVVECSIEDDLFNIGCIYRM